MQTVDFYQMPVASMVVGEQYTDVSWCVNGQYVEVIASDWPGHIKVVEFDVNGGIVGWCSRYGEGDAVADFVRAIRDDDNFAHGSNGYYVDFDAANTVPAEVIFRNVV